MLITPGCTTATRLTLSISRILFILVKTRTIPPRTGTDPPARLVPAPRAVTGIFSREATFMIRETSSVLTGRSATSGIA